MASYKYTKFLSVQLKSHHEPLDGQKERSSYNYHFSEICEGSKLLWKCPEGVTFDVKRDKSGKDPVLLKGVCNNYISNYIDSDDVYIANPSGCSEDFLIEVCSIFASKRQNWISDTVQPTTPIKNIVLPGTHDSAAIHRVRYEIDAYACQEASIYNQLRAGVRLLDIRLKAKDNNGTVSFVTCHGDLLSWLEFNEFEKFSQVIASCKTFLSENPGEFVVMSIKVDDYNNVNSGKVTDALKKLLFETNKELFIEFSDQTLKEVAGKIVVINRYDNNSWDDNKTFSFVYNGTKIYVQDQYNCNKDTKVKAIADAMEHALDEKNHNKVCINFCSGYMSTVKVPVKHKLISDVINLFGQKISSVNQPVNLGWLLFDFVFSTYNVALADGSIEPLDIVDLIIDANRQVHKYYSYHIDNSDKEL